MDELNLSSLTIEELKGLQCLVNKELKEKIKVDQTIEIRSGSVKVVTKRVGDTFSPYVLKVKSIPNDYFIQLCSSEEKMTIIKRITSLISGLEAVRNTLLKRTNLPYNTDNPKIEEAKNGKENQADN